MHNLIPSPASLSSSNGSFKITNETRIITPENTEIARIGTILAGGIRKYASLELEVQAGGTGSTNTINLALTTDTHFGDEGYELSISSDGVVLRAAQPAGLFYASQTLIQLLSTLPAEDLKLPALSITDAPRFTWRGAMLDVARHFFSVEDVKRYIDLLSHYKMNRLHLHLTDDQGWRIEVKAWPKLTEIGARTQVNGGG
ncbi:MAG: family 20 glycosylhydrolase, partial [Anaerolineales bacterium]|nr:family 20 glycosylhydrolase [Anaerolineales bacterium]